MTYVLIEIKGGLIQSVSSSENSAKDLIVAVKDFDIMEDGDDVIHDEEKNLCSWSFWDGNSIETLNNQQIEFIRHIHNSIKERRISPCEKFMRNCPE